MNENNKAAYDALAAIPLEEIPRAKVMVKIINRDITGHGMPMGMMGIIKRRNREASTRYEVKSDAGTWWVETAEFALLPKTIEAITEVIKSLENKIAKIKDFQSLLEADPNADLSSELWKATLIVKISEKEMPIDQKRKEIAELLLLTPEELFNILT